MDKLKDSIRTCIRENRPNLSEKSMAAYVSTLSNLPKKLEDNPSSCEYYTTHSGKIIELLKDREFNKRKSILSPLVVLTGLESYKELMKGDIEKYEETQLTQTKTEKEDKNWIEWDEVLKIHATMKKNVEKNHKKKDRNLTNTEDVLIEYICLSMYVLFPPRRLEWGTVKLRYFDTEKDNYVDLHNKEIVFNKYKTSKTYGKQVFPMDSSMYKLMKFWMKKNQEEYLFFEEFSSPQMTLLLNKIFKPTGKRVSANMLRHSFLTNYYQNYIEKNDTIPPLTIMNDLAEKMAHSIEMQMKYLKNN